jgi:hypothetical protein
MKPPSPHTAITFVLERCDEQIRTFAPYRHRDSRDRMASQPAYELPLLPESELGKPIAARAYSADSFF